MPSNVKNKIIVITEDLSGIRIDKVLGALPEIGSRTHAAQLISNGLVQLNNQPVKASHKTQIGDVFSYSVPQKEQASLAPYNFNLDIVYEDESLIVINKPSGLVVHPAAGHAQDTLVNALIFLAKKLSGDGADLRPGVVHRLDKDTSGLLVIAKTDAAHRFLSEQFKNKTAHRIYEALVFGALKNKSGKIESLLKRHPKNRKRFSSQTSGRRAITHYRLIKNYNNSISHIELRLETGRTHQIRVHMSELGHPLVADPIYTSERRASSIRNRVLKQIVLAAPRLCLHAKELGFIHPSTKKELRFSVDWPDDLKNVFLSLSQSE